MKKFLHSTIFRLLLSIIIGIAVGFLTLDTPDSVQAVLIQFYLITKQVASQVILFIVPLIIIGCVAPSITGFSGNVTKMLFFTIGIAYLSTICAALMSIGVGYGVVPTFSIGMDTATRELPATLIELKFPTMDTMSALLFAILIGLGTIWIGSERFKSVLQDFQRMVMAIVQGVLVPVLPLFIGANFALLAIEGKLSMLQVYLPAVGCIIAMQLIWIVVTYGVATLYSRKNGWKVLKTYPPAYFTAIGTMSSAATLPVALECIAKAKDEVSEKTSGFAIPLFSNIHLCGAVITEMFLVLTTYYTFFHQMPDIVQMVIFAILVSIIAIGSPGVPGGINMSCIGLVYTLIIGHEDQSFFAIMTAIYAVQDGFGTACNVTCDGALAMITDRFLKKQDAKESAA